MKTLASIFVIAATLTLAHKAQASNASAWLGQCRYYPERSTELNCKDDGYLVAFGERYCQVFVDHESEFTAAGQVTLASLRLCLQQELEKRDDLTCENVSGIAAASHLTCYTQNHFCQMNWRDKLTLGRLVAPAMTDPDLRHAVESIEAECWRQRLEPHT